MTVKELIKNYLEEKGFDGLCSDDCGCGVNDLFPCGEIPDDCVPAYKCNCDHHCDDYLMCWTSHKMDKCVMED